MNLEFLSQSVLNVLKPTMKHLKEVPFIKNNSKIYQPGKEEGGEKVMTEKQKKIAELKK